MRPPTLSKSNVNQVPVVYVKLVAAERLLGSTVSRERVYRALSLIGLSGRHFTLTLSLSAIAHMRYR
jgi:hypothetical protein